MVIDNYRKHMEIKITQCYFLLSVKQKLITKKKNQMKPSRSVKPYTHKNKVYLIETLQNIQITKNIHTDVQYIDSDTQ